MTSTLSPLPAAKLLVSMFNVLNPLYKTAEINDDTVNQVQQHITEIGIAIKLPVQIRLADEYAELFAHTLNEVNNAINTADATNEVVCALVQQKHEGAEYSKKISTTKTVLGDMQKAGVINVAANFMPVIR